MKYFIKTTEDMGRGIWASMQGAAIRKGEVLFQNEVLVLDPFDSVLLESTALKYYVYTYNNEQSCLLLGEGTLLNHSINPNVAYTLTTVGDRKVMSFYALRDIELGEQLFIDYGADETINVNEYLSRPSLY